MPDLAIFGVSLAALQLVRAHDPDCTLAGLLGEVAGGRGDQSISSLLGTIEQRLSHGNPEENHDIKKALLEAYWVAALQVAADYGFRISAPLTQTELLAAPQNSGALLAAMLAKAAKAWAAAKPPPDGPVGIM